MPGGDEACEFDFYFLCQIVLIIYVFILLSFCCFVVFFLYRRSSHLKDILKSAERYIEVRRGS